MPEIKSLIRMEAGSFYGAKYNVRHHVVTEEEALFITVLSCCITDASGKWNYDEINLTLLNPTEHKSHIFDKDQVCKK